MFFIIATMCNIELVCYFNTVANKYVSVNVQNFVGTCNVFRGQEDKVYVRTNYMYT